MPKSPIWSKEFCEVIDYLFEEFYDDEEEDE